MFMKYFFMVIMFLLVTSNAFPQNGWQSSVSPTNTNLNSIFFVNGTTGFIAGGYGSSPNPFTIILKTTNSGLNWNSVYQVNSAGLQDIFFISPQIGYAVGGYYPYSYILKTTNGGNNWFSQNSGLTKALYSVVFLNENTGFVCADWGTIIKTTNGGNNWIQTNSCSPDYLECITFVNNLTGYSVGRVGQIIKSTDGGENWSYLVNYSSWLNSIAFINSDVGFTVGQSGKILKTQNAGITWTQINLGLTNDLHSVRFINNNTGYITGSNGLILYTSNSGNNWIAQNTGTTTGIISLHFSDVLNIYACGYNGLILKSQTGGQTAFVPELISPANNAYNIPLTPTLKWTTGAGVMDYTVQVSPFANFSLIVDSVTTTLNQRVVPSGKLNTATTYFWRVRANTTLGINPWSSMWNFATIISSVLNYSSSIPENYELTQNFPNPFNARTIIKFSIVENGRVSLSVFDIQGKEVESIINSELNPGEYSLSYDANLLPSGIYFYKLTAGNKSFVKKMILTK